MVAILESKVCSTTKGVNDMLKLVFIFVWLWIIYEIYSAPMMDEKGNVIKPGKKLSDLWRKRH